jgi:prophage regulatory protein
MTEPTPIGPHEIAVMLNVTRQRVMQLRAREDFPAPWATLATGHIWRAEDIAAWAELDGRTVHPIG